MLKSAKTKTSRLPMYLSYLLIWSCGVLIMIQDVDAAEDPGGGQLIVRSGEESYALPALNTTVALEVAGPLIKVELRQEFTNPTDETIEAIYVFPLPDQAVVYAMELLVGERRIVSVVQEKAEARRTYEAARTSGRRTSLVERQSSHLFSTAVANIGPREKVTIRLEYLDQAAYENDWFALVVPLTFTPRYFPATGGGVESGQSSPQAAESRAVVAGAAFVSADDPTFPQVSIDVQLNPGVELADLLSPSHELSVHRNGGLWLAGPRQRSVPADRDFILRWRPVSAALAQPALFFEDRPDGRYAFLMIVPGRANEAVATRPNTETLFVVDVSGSMDGPSLVQAKEALVAALTELAVGDRFNIMAFNNRSHFWCQEFQSVSPATLGAARRWVEHLRAEGGTELHPALLLGQTAFLSSIAGQRARRIILLTDAAVGNEDQLLRQTIARLADIRLHVVGIGRAPNRYLVRRLAGQGGGLSLFVSGHGGDTARLVDFLTRIGRPQLADPHLVWAGEPEVEAYPARLGAPFAGELTLWSGRFPVGTDLEGFLQARWADQELALPLGGQDISPAAGVAIRWANLKVDDLLAAYDSGGDASALRAEIVDTGLAFGLVTRFTSRVAVEDLVTTNGVTSSRRLANGLPAGSTLLGQLPRGGTLAPLWRALGLVLLLTGLAGWQAHRKAASSCC